jgi:hypothetical protein
MAYPAMKFAMEDMYPAASPGFSAPVGPFQGPFADAIRYWEPRRLVYNLILIAVTVAWVAVTWPHFRPALTPHSLLPMAVLALLANVCYCAAYVVDFAMLHSSLASIWRRRRWILWLAGTIFATVLASYWIADEIYPDFN